MTDTFVQPEHVKRWFSPRTSVPVEREEVAQQLR